MSNPEML